MSYGGRPGRSSAAAAAAGLNLRSPPPLMLQDEKQDVEGRPAPSSSSTAIVGFEAMQVQVWKPPKVQTSMVAATSMFDAASHETAADLRLRFFSLAIQ